MSDIQHAHLYGMREAKYDWLSTHDVNSTDWKEVELQKPFHLFIPQDNDLLGEFQSYWKITEAMTVNVLGFQTHRDNFAIDFDLAAIQQRLDDLRNPDISDQEIQEKYDVKDNRDWHLKDARKQIQKDIDWEQWLIKCDYRPFDQRYCYFSTVMMDYPRRELVDHVAERENLCLLVPRQIGTSEWQHTGVSSTVAESCTLSNKTREGNYNFPLYLYPDKNNPQTSTTEQQRRPNFSDEFLTEITNKLGYTPTPEAIFYYIYAIFHSPTYRTRYAEFLKIDLPRVPLTSSDQLFRKLGGYGEELVALHLMKSPKLDPPVLSDTPLTKGGRGDLQIIDKGGEFIVDAGHPKFLPSPTGRGAGGEGGEVIINKKGDRFTGVPQSVWEFYVGGYQVCHKWLKDRKGRQLSPADLNHYQKIIVALSETMQIMNAIDAAIPSFPIE